VSRVACGRDPGPHRPLALSFVKRAHVPSLTSRTSLERLNFTASALFRSIFPNELLLSCICPFINGWKLLQHAVVMKRRDWLHLVEVLNLPVCSYPHFKLLSKRYRSASPESHRPSRLGAPTQCAPITIYILISDLMWLCKTLTRISDPSEPVPV